MATMRWELWEEYGGHDGARPDMKLISNHQTVKLTSRGFAYDVGKEVSYILGQDDPIYGVYPVNMMRIC